MEFLKKMNIESNFKTSQQWLTFLENLFIRFSEYDFQNDRIECADLNDSENLQIFLEKVRLSDLSKDLKNYHPSDYELKLLEEVLNILLKKKNKIVCDNDKLIIKNDFVKLSDVKNELENCLKTEKTEFQLEIFATNKIFINENLNQTGKKQKLVMIAPTIEVIGSKMIILNGEDGKNLHSDTRICDTIFGKLGELGKIFFFYIYYYINYIYYYY